MNAFAQVDPDEARRIAQEILSERRFRPSRTPRPLKGVIDQLGEWLQPIGEFFRRLFDGAARHVPGGRSSVWLILAIVVIAVGVIASLLLIRRRSEVEAASARLLPGASAFDPEALERAAAEAEQAGDLERAIRLRFRAGLLRLDKRGVIDFRDSITSREISRKLRSPAFDGLARDFDEIVYGRRPPQREDADRAREGWDAVLSEPRAA